MYAAGIQTTADNEQIREVLTKSQVPIAFWKGTAIDSYFVCCPIKMAKESALQKIIEKMLL